MLLIYYDHVIQQLPTGTANPALRRAVLPWASIRGPLRFYAKILDRFCHLVGNEWLARHGCRRKAQQFRGVPILRTDILTMTPQPTEHTSKEDPR